VAKFPASEIEIDGGRVLAMRDEEIRRLEVNGEVNDNDRRELTEVAAQYREVRTAEGGESHRA